MTTVSTSLLSGKRFRLQCLFLIQFLLLSLNTEAAVREIDGIYYTLDVKTGQAEVAGSNLLYIVIPDSVVYEGRTFHVTAVGKRAFYQARPKSISLPNSVKAIRESAFMNVRYIREIPLPNGVKTIEPRAFHGCKELELFHIPDSLESLGWSVFDECKNIDSVFVNSLEHWLSISRGSLGCNIPHLIANGKEVTDLTIPSTISTILPTTFYYCTGLKTVTIPEGVTDIGSYAFAGCSNLESVSIANSVSNIDGSVFSGCSKLTEITIPEGVTVISDYLFSGCSSLRSVNLPKHITSIGYSAFSDCTGLTSFVVPEKTVTIGIHAFSRCSALASVSLPEGLDSIGGSAFMECTALSSITIPSSVTYIGNYAFGYLGDNLKEFICLSPQAPDTGWSWQSPFSYTDIDFAKLYVPSESIDHYKSTAPWSNFGEVLPITTGIGKTHLMDDGRKTYYDLQGRRLNAKPSKGVYIQRSAEGRLQGKNGKKYVMK